MTYTHNWEKSPLGHGESMCTRCLITNREAAVLDRLNICNVEPPLKTKEAIQPLTPAHTSDRWDRHFLKLAAAHASMSKDPSSQVGAVIVGPNKECRSFGFNGFPRRMADTPERLVNREIKYPLIVHAELNAILAAAMIGIPTAGCTLYHSFGGSCTRCAASIIQAGITEVVYRPLASLPDRWLPDMEFAKQILGEAGVLVREIPF